MRGWYRQVAVVLVLCVGLFGVSGPVSATTPGDPSATSPSYSVIESEIGGNGQFSSSSNNFNINPNIDDGGSSLGESVVGNSASTSYLTNSGFNTTAQPGLSLVVNQSSMDLGVLSTVITSANTATFTVSDYTSYGYVVQVFGTPPAYNGHQLTAMGNNTSPASAGAAEQFGINLRANNSPNVTGSADPLEVPDNAAFGSSTFSYGQAGNYGQGGTTYGVDRTYSVPNKYTFNSGDIIASASKTSGPTLYTISFLANITNVTPGGRYAGNLTFVATGTF